MKLAISAIFASFFALFVGTAFAGSTEKITGCATALAAGSNFTVRIDPNCALSDDSDSEGIFALVTEVFEDLKDQAQAQ